MDGFHNHDVTVILAATCEVARQQVLSALESEGHAVREHPADASLLDELRTIGPAMLFLGCHKGSTSIAEICKNVKQDPSLGETPVIAVLCDNGNWDEAHRLLEAGGDGVLEAGGELRQISARLRQILHAAETGRLLQQKINALQASTEKLIASSQTFIKAFRNNPSAMCMTRLDDGVIFEVNSGFLRLFGYRREEVVGRTSLQLNLFEDVSQREAIFQELRSRGVVSEREVRMRNRQGQTKLGMFFIEPLELGGKHILLTVINDITELKHARDALERSNEKIAIECSGLGVWDWRVQEGNVTINDAWATMLGFRREELGELSYRMWEQFCHPDDLPQVLEQLHLHLQGVESSFSAEVRMRHRDGHWLWVQSVGRVTLRADDGTPLRMAGTHADISRRKQAELAAVAANAYNRGLIEANLDPLVTIGVDGRIQDVNRATELITGFSRESLVNTDFSDYFTEPYRAREGYRKVFQDGYVRDYQLVLKHRSGRCTPVLYNATVYLDNSGSVAGVFAAARDISHQLETEFKLHAMSQVLEEGPSSVYITDACGNIEYVNQAFSRMSGYTLDEVKGISAKILRSDEHQESHYQEIWMLLLQGKSWKGDLCRRRKDGSTYWVSVLFAPVRDFNGRVVRYVAISEDISAKRRSEELLRKAKDLAEEASRAKSIFLANMSHEIRTPLNAIIGYAKWLQGRDEIRGESLERLEIISQSGNHLLGLINSLLEVSKLEAGRIALEESFFSPRELLASVAGMFDLQFQNKRLEFITELAMNLPDEVFADAGKIRQILINLLGNAAKFTEQGRVKLESSSSSEGTAQVWTIHVEDSGPGISAKEVSQLFRRFEQTETGKKLQTGSGLGLAISREYARLMGGDLTVRSEPDSGSRFTLWVPLRQVRQRCEISPDHSSRMDKPTRITSAPSPPRMEYPDLCDAIKSRLLEALRLGDSRNLMKILLEMEESNPSWFAKLRALADHYEYDQMRELILKHPSQSIVSNS